MTDERVRCEEMDDHFCECGLPAAGVCLAWGMAMCREHCGQCLLLGHGVRWLEECLPPGEFADGGGI